MLGADGPRWLPSKESSSVATDAAVGVGAHPESPGESAPELGGHWRFLGGRGTGFGLSGTFQDLVEAPEEYPPHFGQVKGHLLQGRPGVVAEVGQGLSACYGSGKECVRPPPTHAGGMAGPMASVESSPASCWSGGPCSGSSAGEASRDSLGPPPALSTDRPAGPRGQVGSPQSSSATAQRPRGACRGGGAGGRRLCAQAGGRPGGCRCGGTGWGHHRPERVGVWRDHSYSPGPRPMGPRSLLTQFPHA